ncbi:hypothetical protein BE20_03225 [Sorangium cellulosum]|nr:hypothetical protein BE20_03225 [Sorangium cellulosum]
MPTKTPVFESRSDAGTIPASSSACHDEQEAVLRVDVLRLARADPEEIGVEEVDAIEHGGVAHVALADGVRIGVVRRVRVPAARGDRRDGVAALLEERPERVAVVDPAREAQPEADDGDRLMSPLFRRT